MSKIFPAIQKKPSFGEIIGGGLGQGFSQGASMATQMSQQLMFEKYKQGLLQKQALAGNPYSQQQGDALKGGGTDSSNNPTGYQDQPLLDPQQIKDRGNKLAYERTKAGNPTTPEQGQAIVQQEHANNAQYRTVQREYGQISEDALNKVFEDAPDEMKAVFKKKGEGYAREGLSEADIARKVAQDAKNFKNMYSQAEKLIPKDRSQAVVRRGLTGRSATETAHAKNAIKPLLDAGLYDTARDVLSKAEYDLEERESLISSLGETASKSLAEMPDFKPKKGSFKRNVQDLFSGKLSTEKAQEAKGYLNNIFQKDPSVNLVLLRKAADAKGIDWETFRDTVNEAQMDGTLNLTPDSDQFKFLEDLQQPPLDKLGTILHGIKLKGK